MLKEREERRVEAVKEEIKLKKMERKYKREKKDTA